MRLWTMSLVKWCLCNSRCRWLVSWASLLGSKSSNWRMAPSLGKKDMQEIYWRSSRWMIARLPKHQCHQVNISTRMQTVNRWTKSFIDLWSDLCASRPNIMFSVCLCARFQDGPQESHLTAVKRILKYIKHTPSIGLWYPKGTSFELLGYSDLDFAGFRVDHKSTTDGCYFLGHSLVAWVSRKQNSMALSTTEEEYIATGACCAQILYIK